MTGSVADLKALAEHVRNGRLATKSVHFRTQAQREAIAGEIEASIVGRKDDVRAIVRIDGNANIERGLLWDAKQQMLDIVETRWGDEDALANLASLVAEIRRNQRAQRQAFSAVAGSIDRELRFLAVESGLTCAHPVVRACAEAIRTANQSVEQAKEAHRIGKEMGL